MALRGATSPMAAAPCRYSRGFWCCPGEPFHWPVLVNWSENLLPYHAAWNTLVVSPRVRFAAATPFCMGPSLGQWVAPFQRWCLSVSQLSLLRPMTRRLMFDCTTGNRREKKIHIRRACRSIHKCCISSLTAAQLVHIVIPCSWSSEFGWKQVTYKVHCSLACDFDFLINKIVYSVVCSSRCHWNFLYVHCVTWVLWNFVPLSSFFSVLYSDIKLSVPTSPSLYVRGSSILHMLSWRMTRRKFAAFFLRSATIF